VCPTKSDHRPVTCLDVLDGGGRSASSDGCENLAVLLNVDNGGTRGGVGGATRARGSSTRESHGAKVHEGNKATVLLKVFNDPLGILLTKSIRRGEFLCDDLASGQVLDDCCTRSRRGSSDGGLDNITSADADAREIVGIVRVPLVPSYSTNER
jgi:hypothetical protein